MTSTTLVTFFLDSVHGYSSVQILGSWDNFTTPYDLEKDKQKGHGCWYGCFLFDNIICDGDPSQSAGSRKGGLKMGGTYWYYFKLNGHIEYHSSSAPRTSSCPLLPGQTVNFIEVPYESTSFVSGQSEISTGQTFTLDPKARFVTPKPPPERTRDDSPPKHIVRPRKFISTRRPQTSVIVERCAKFGGSIHIIRNELLGTKPERRPKSAPSKVTSRRDSVLEQEVTITNIVEKKPSSALPRRGPSYRRHLSVLDRTPGWNPFRKIPEVPLIENSDSDVVTSRPPTRRGSERPKTWSPGYNHHPAYTLTKSSRESRPVSAPSRSAVPEPEITSRTSTEIRMERQKSLRLRVACAKLRTMINEPGKSVDNGWILDRLPEDFSSLLQGFQRQPMLSDNISEQGSSSSKTRFPDLEDDSTPQKSIFKRKQFRPQLQTLYSGNDADDTRQFPTLTTVARSKSENELNDVQMSQTESNISNNRNHLQWTPGATSPSTEEEWGGSGWDSPPGDGSGSESPISLPSDVLGRSLRGSYELPYESKHHLSRILESQETIKAPGNQHYQLAPQIEGLKKLSIDEEWDPFRDFEQQWLSTPRSVKTNEDTGTRVFRAQELEQHPFLSLMGQSELQGDNQDVITNVTGSNSGGADSHLGDLGYLSTAIL